MLLLLALSMLSIATVASVVAYQRQATARLKGAPVLPELPPAAAATERTFETLEVGDVVSWGSEDWVVHQRAIYDEEGERWWMYALDHGGTKFLEARRPDGTEVSFFTIADDAPLFGQLSQGLTFRGESYSLDSRGDARVGIAARVPTAGFASGRLRYSRYKGPGGLWLVIEEQGERRRAFAGEVVAKGTLSLMPGDAASVRRTETLDDELNALAKGVEGERKS